MASEKSLRSLEGKWSMSNSQSSGIAEVLEIQGFGTLMRKAAPLAPITLHIRQHADKELFIDQTTTASIPGIREEWYPADHEWREQKDKLMGKVKSRSRWARVAELEGADPQLVQGLEQDDEVIEAEVQSLEAVGWHARQVWCFEGQKFVRRVLVTGEGGQDAFSRLVYEAKE